MNAKSRSRRNSGNNHVDCEEFQGSAATSKVPPSPGDRHPSPRRPWEGMVASGYSRFLRTFSRPPAVSPTPRPIAQSFSYQRSCPPIWTCSPRPEDTTFLLEPSFSGVCCDPLEYFDQPTAPPIIYCSGVEPLISSDSVPCCYTCESQAVPVPRCPCLMRSPDYPAPICYELPLQSHRVQQQSFPVHETGPPKRPCFPQPIFRQPPSPPAYRPVLPLPYDPHNDPRKLFLRGKDHGIEVPPNPTVDLSMPSCCPCRAQETFTPSNYVRKNAGDRMSQTCNNQFVHAETHADECAGSALKQKIYDKIRTHTIHEGIQTSASNFNLNENVKNPKVSEQRMGKNMNLPDRENCEDHDKVPAGQTWNYANANKLQHTKKHANTGTTTSSSSTRPMILLPNSNDWKKKQRNQKSIGKSQSWGHNQESRARNQPKPTRSVNDLRQQSLMNGRCSPKESTGSKTSPMKTFSDRRGGEQH